MMRARTTYLPFQPIKMFILLPFFHQLYNCLKTDRFSVFFYPKKNLAQKTEIVPKNSKKYHKIPKCARKCHKKARNCDITHFLDKTA